MQERKNWDHKKRDGRSGDGSRDFRSRDNRDSGKSRDFKSRDDRSGEKRYGDNKYGDKKSGDKKFGGNKPGTGKPGDRADKPAFGGRGPYGDRRPDNEIAGKRLPHKDNRIHPHTEAKDAPYLEKQNDKPGDKLPAAMIDADDADDRIEGRNPVLEAIRAGRSINKIFVSKGDREGSITQIVAMAREKHIIVQEVERVKLDAMSATHAHQGVIALVAAKAYVEVDDIIEAAAAKKEPPFIIILDEISDPHNLGSILRSANAAGAHGVIIPKRRAVGLTALVAKASAGAVEYVPVARVTNISQTIEYLKKQNIWVVGTDSTGPKAFYDHDLKGPIALVVGSEGEGMGKLVRESCDFVVNIPMKGEVSSLNAAVAGAIVMYEIQRQREK